MKISVLKDECFDKTLGRIDKIGQCVKQWDIDCGIRKLSIVCGHCNISMIN